MQLVYCRKLFKTLKHFKRYIWSITKFQRNFMYNNICDVLYSITKTTIKYRQITLINISMLQTDDKIELFFFYYY